MNLRFMLVMMVTVIVFGCSGSKFDLADVQGVVTLDGKPQSGVILSFKQQDGVRPSGGTSNADGTYRLIFDSKNAGAMVGENQVSFLAEGGLAKKLGTPPSTLLTKRVQVESGDNIIDLELRDFEQGEE